MPRTNTKSCVLKTTSAPSVKAKPAPRAIAKSAPSAKAKNPKDYLSFFDFCNKLETHSYWEGSPKQFPKTNIQALKERYEDKNLYLGVVGEFSSGKSTLINAILHQNLLKEDILQGTTCAPTFIQFDEKFDIIIKYTRGKEAKFSSQCQDKTILGKIKKGDIQSIDFQTGPIREFIDKYTATEAYSAKLDRVTVYLNNPILQNGLVIVDTPGINASIKRHSTVTKQTLERYCDAAVIMTPANAPCSETLCDFVRKNLAGLENRCLGIVSKIDSLRRTAEQNSMVDFVKTRFKSELGKPLAATLPVSALYSQGENEDAPPLKPELYDHYKTMFLEFEKIIQERLINGREAILAQSLHKSNLETIGTLQKCLAPLKEEHAQRSQDLKSNKLSDLEKWYDDFKTGYKRSSGKSSSKSEIGVLYDDIKSDIFDEARYQIYSCTSITKIKNYLRNSLSKLCKKYQRRVTNQLKKIQENYVKLEQIVNKDFLEQFNTEFRNLAHNKKLPALPMPRLPRGTCSVSIPEISLSDWGLDDLWVFLESVFGDLITLFVRLDSAKKKAYAAASNVLNKFLKSLRSWLQKVNAQMKRSTFTFTDKIVKDFQPIIAEIIAQERSELQKIQRQKNQIGKDLETLHQFELECKSK